MKQNRHWTFYVYCKTVKNEICKQTRKAKSDREKLTSLKRRNLNTVYPILRLKEFLIILRGLKFYCEG